MKRLVIVIVMIVSLFPRSRASVWFEVDFDPSTFAMMQETYLEAFVAEGLNISSIEQLLSSYEEATLAATGIYASKYLDRQAMKDAGLLASAAENYYYQHIHYLVEYKILPRVVFVGSLLLKHPDKALYWGPNICKILDEVKQLCKEFEVVVSNGRLSFDDISWLDVVPELRQFFNLAKLGEVDWKQLWEDFTDFPKNYTKDDLLADFKKYLASYSSITMAGSDIIQWNAESSIFKGIEEKPNDFKDIFTGFQTVYDNITSGTAFKDFLEGVVGDLQDSLAVRNMFISDGYNISDFISNYLNNFGGTFYTQRYYIYTDFYGYRKVVYEDIFDSKLNDLETFEKGLEILREDYERNDPVNGENIFRPVRYKIGKDSKNTYTVEDENTVRGTSSASFTVRCDTVVELAKNSFNFKVNPSYDGSKLHDYAMPYGTNIGPNKPDVSDWDAKIAELQSQAQVYNDQIDAIKSQISDLEAERDTISDASRISSINTQIWLLYDDIATLESQRKPIDDELQPLLNAREELEVDYDEELDGPYRIIHAMNDVAGLVGVHWDEEGSWSGDDFIRMGHIVGEKFGGKVKFIAEVRLTRGEKFFLFIRIHRAIITVNWRLVSELESGNVVDMITFDDDMEDSEKADIVNKRLDELRAENPGCEVSVSYHYKTPPEKDSDEEALHLLWTGDRVAIAREVDQRLMNIHSGLVLLEKWLRDEESILDCFKKALTNVNRSYHRTIFDVAFDRWITVGQSGGVMVH